MSPLCYRFNSAFSPTASMAGTALVALTATVVAMFFVSQGGNLSSTGATVCGGIGAAALTGFIIASVVAMRVQGKNRDSLTPPPDSGTDTLSGHSPAAPALLRLPSSNSAFSRPRPSTTSTTITRTHQTEPTATLPSSGTSTPEFRTPPNEWNTADNARPIHFQTSSRASSIYSFHSLNFEVNNSDESFPSAEEPEQEETSSPNAFATPRASPGRATPLPASTGSENSATAPSPSANGTSAATREFTKVPAHPDVLTEQEPNNDLLNKLIAAVVQGSPNIQTQINELSDAVMDVFAALASAKNCKKYHLTHVEENYVPNIKQFLNFFSKQCLTPELFIWGPLVQGKSTIVELINTAINYTGNPAAIRLTTYHISTSMWGAIKASALDWVLKGSLKEINKSLNLSLSDDEFEKIFPFVSSLIIQYRTKNSPLMELFQKHLNACRQQFATLRQQEHEFADFSTQAVTMAKDQIQALINEINE